MPIQILVSFLFLDNVLILSRNNDAGHRKSYHRPNIASDFTILNLADSKLGNRNFNIAYASVSVLQ